MTDHEQNSATASSAGAENTLHTDIEIGKTTAILALRDILINSPSVQSGGSLDTPLSVFIHILDSIEALRTQAGEWGIRNDVEDRETEANRENREEDDEQEAPSLKKSKALDSSKFPWASQRSAALISLPADIRETFTQLENFSADPSGVVQDILSTPGCPRFPPSEWLNIVRWKYVDLSKVLNSAHTTELDPKRTHVIDDQVELAFRVSKSLGSIKTSSDLIFAFGIDEFTQYHSYLGRLFYAIEVPMHGQIIEFDKAVRNQMAMQRNLRLTDHSQFEELRTTYLTSFGIGSNTSASASGTGKKSDRREGTGGRNDPCHKWNRGTCEKSDAESAPMPRPPLFEFENLEALNTIKSCPDLFKVSTPICVDVFKSLLAHHPNPAFVDSVCLGLREGFWPYTNTHFDEWPLTHDNSFRPPKTSAEEEFLRAQIDKEVEVERYSQPFGPDLLPGTYSMPIHAVPKPNSDKHRLVTDHSTGRFALNSMISHKDIAGVTLDNVQDLGNGLCVFRRSNPTTPLVIWKADMSEAYHQMPMHPLWQIKQIVTFQGHHYVDRRNVFGGRASQRIFHAFMSLVTWIVIFNLLLFFLYLYVDDSFSFQEASSMELYSPYKKMLPQNLVRLLRLWDAIGLPHEERKQIFGPELPVIGFDVDPNLMRVRMSDESRLTLIQSILDFAQRGTRRSLRDFQRLAGHLNWALNIYPLLRPGLSASYAKTAGKQESWAVLWVNQDITQELSWIVQHL
ncbi:hypothetical protein EDB19DRAFT_1916120 [Suillus lakei]|nr:hypothetical protein EDB19DRAFT_1916120 [Suillus lakei]